VPGGVVSVGEFAPHNDRLVPDGARRESFYRIKTARTGVAGTLSSSVAATGRRHISDSSSQTAILAAAAVSTRQ